MMNIEEKAYAKLNLSLDVVSRLPDGYHAMKMVMQSVSLCDDVVIELNDSGEITAKTDLRYLPCDDRNLAARAARLFFEATGREGQGAEINLKKRIPVCAGLGGGSSDAAAVLRGLNRLTGAGMTEKELCAIAGRIGSDVAFCVAGGTALAEGKGEVLTDLTPLPSCGIVICKPKFSISTPELFSRIRCEKIRCRPNTEGMLHALEEGDLLGVACRSYNVFEDVLPARFAEIQVIRSRLLNSGALGSAMSGTGSAVFGLFESIDTAREVYEELRKSYRECFIAQPVKKLDI